MSLFSKKTKTDKKPAATVHSARAEGGIFELSHVIAKPRITEKATFHSAQGVYVFDIDIKANKHQVAQAVRAIYSVIPRKVRIVTIPSKRKRSARTGKLGIRGGGKKAYVYLNKGDSITMN